MKIFIKITFILSSLLFGLFTQAMTSDKFISFHGAVDFSGLMDGEIQNERARLSFGHNIVSPMEDYFGFVEASVELIGAFEPKQSDYLFSLKYGYEQMLHDRFSLGADVGGLFGVHDARFNIENLAFGVVGSVFSQVRIVNSLSFLLRVGVYFTSPVNSFQFNTDSLYNPFIEFGLRYYL